MKTMTKLNLSDFKAKLRPLLDPGWTTAIGEGVVGIGHDVATTEGELSNPSSLTVTEKLGGRFFQRLVLRWKAEEYKTRLALVELVVDDLFAAGKRPRRLVIDATNERGFAQMTRDQLAGRVVVEFYIASQGMEQRGVKYSARQLLGDRYVQTFEDNVMALPAGDWLYADHQLVKNSHGSYVYEEDKAGNHADSFVSGQLSVWAVTGTAERMEITAAGPGGAPGGRRGIVVPPERPKLFF